MLVALIIIFSAGAFLAGLVWRLYVGSDAAYPDGRLPE
jgi:hypothetical protein